MSDKNNKTLKPGWRRVKFGDVVRLSKARSQDPLADGIERYVGLEHLEPGDLRIRNWGNVADGVTFTSVFQPGQVLFGKRRAYQRKVAVADFPGVCSGDIYVLESKDAQVLLPELLPFICQTDAFFDHAVGTSAGSLSPRTNWTSLADFEFALPKIDEQTRIVETLLAFEKNLEAMEVLLNSARQVVKSAINSLLTSDHDLRNAVARFSSTSEINLPDGWSLSIASAVCGSPVTSGSTPREGITDVDTGHPFLRVQNLSFDGRLDFSSTKYLENHSFISTKKTHVLPGDILTNIVGPPLGKVSLVPEGFSEAQINQAIVRFRPKNSRLGKYLTYYLMSEFAKSWLFSRSKKTSGQRNINSSTCACLPVPMPPDGQIAEISQRMDSFFEVLKQIETRKASLINVRMHLLAQATGGSRV